MTGERGLTLIELLVASALVLAVIGAAAALASPVRRAFDRGLSTAETVARARTAVATIVDEARRAGAGVVIGPPDVRLAAVMPVVTRLSPSSVAITRAPGPQGLLRVAAKAGELSISLDSAKPCIGQDATCGVRTGDQAVVFDRTRSESITVAGVTNESATLHLAVPLVATFDAGATVAVVEQTTFRVRDRRLVRITAGGAEQPIADHISAFAVSGNANRLDLLLRLEAQVPGTASLELRTSIGVRK